MLSLLGTVTGLLAGVVILAFRQVMEGMQEWIVPVIMYCCQVGWPSYR